MSTGGRMGAESVIAPLRTRSAYDFYEIHIQFVDRVCGGELVRETGQYEFPCDDVGYYFESRKIAAGLREWAKQSGLAQKAKGQKIQRILSRGTFISPDRNYLVNADGSTEPAGVWSRALNVIMPKGPRRVVRTTQYFVGCYLRFILSVKRQTGQITQRQLKELFAFGELCGGLGADRGAGAGRFVTVYWEKCSKPRNHPDVETLLGPSG